MRSNDMPGTPEDNMRHGGHTVRRAKRARGGKAGGHEIHAITGAGSPEAHEAEEEEEDFKRGGKAHRRDGGKAEGEMTHERPDRPRRGKRAAGGRAHGHHTDHDGDHDGHHRPEHESEHDGKHKVDHDGHGGHAHGPHHHSVEHEGSGHHHHGPAGPIATHHGSGHIHVHRARGGRTGAMAGGHSPMSTGHKGVGRDDSNSPAARGFEGIKAPDGYD